MKAALIVFVGAGMGGVLRHLINVGCARLCGVAFPWGTLTVNIVGSALMGLVVGLLAFRLDAAWSQSARLFVATGILGGFTTFSAFSLDTMLLAERGQPGLALAYVGGSVILSVGALAAALAAVRSFG